MKLKTLRKLLWDGKAPALLSVVRLARPFHRACFVAAAASSGLLAELARGPRTFDELAHKFAPQPSLHEAFRAWLQFGQSLRELKFDGQRYSLRGRLAKSLARPKNDAAAAALEELVWLHHRFIVESPGRFRQSRKFDLTHQDGMIVARSSRILEPFVEEAIDRVLPSSGPFRLLEVGCGSGTYLRYGAARNAQLTGVGVEFQEEVARFARQNVSAWQLTHRITIENGDIRARTPVPEYDLVTLHNNVYYFPGSERPALFVHLRGFLRTKGVLLVTTGCQGGSSAMEILNLCAAVMEGGGPLPTRNELIGQLRHAGFEAVTARRLIPGEAYYSFSAVVGNNESAT